MRIKEKNSLLRIINVLYKFHKQLERLICEKKYNKLMEVSADCNEAAKKILVVLQQKEESLEAICLAKSYCEIIAISTKEMYSEQEASQLKKRLDVCLEKLECSINNTVKGKLEVVFMPYKASMWDSLESLWLAAKEDINCKTHVVPIPYYDRNSDMTLGEKHYEGDCFPKYVDIENYRDFELENIQPDIIYIHNPYDQYNSVTSVAPQYYSAELKKYTEYLVYIPYFIIANQSSQINVVNIPLCKNVDKVILQSDRVLKMASDKLAESLGRPLGDLKNKLIALGSPKIDSIVNMKKEDYELPDAWEKLINGKKVILYNTSIGTALAETKLFMDKLRNTLEYFKERDDIVLWWRPHPLLISTFSAMRKEYVDEYIDIVNKYKNEGYGIYDDTIDYHKALLYSHLYYGDKKSSMATLYSITGKPIVLAMVDADESQVTSFDEDCELYYRDNSSFDILKRNKNPDGTSGEKIHLYIKKEVITCLEKYR